MHVCIQSLTENLRFLLQNVCSPSNGHRDAEHPLEMTKLEISYIISLWILGLTLKLWKDFQGLWFGSLAEI